MSFNSTTLLKLAALRLDPDQMAGVVEILADYEAAEEARKVAQRDRARKSRASRDGNATATRVVRDLPRAGVTPGSDKTSKLDIEPQEQKETPQAALEAVLSPELAREVVAHRKAMKKALTPYGAKLLAKQIASCPDATEAAQAMIANGWQGVKPEYMQNRTRGSPSQKSGGIGSVFDELDRRFENGQDHSSGDDQAPESVVLSLPYRSTGR